MRFEILLGIAFLFLGFCTLGVCIIEGNEYRMYGIIFAIFLFVLGAQLLHEENFLRELRHWRRRRRWEKLDKEKRKPIGCEKCNYRGYKIIDETGVPCEHCSPPRRYPQPEDRPSRAHDNSL